MEPEPQTTDNKRKYTTTFIVVPIIAMAIIGGYLLLKSSNQPQPSGNVVNTEKSTEQIKHDKIIREIVASIPPVASSTQTNQLVKIIPKQTKPLTNEEKTAIVQSIPPPTLQ